MSDDTQELLAYLRVSREIDAIKQLKYRYARILGLARFDELEPLFCEDVTASYSDGKYVANGRAALIQFLRDAHQHVHHLWHMTMPEIVLTGPDSATGTWGMIHYALTRATHDQIDVYGYYSDEYRRVDGQWRIKHTGYTTVLDQTISGKDNPSLTIQLGPGLR
jgi:hypothetical protein